jgi:hypothetical protein
LAPRPNNEGFDAELLQGAGPLPTVIHFTHDDWYLLATWHDGRQWKTARLGRQGDGSRHLTAATPDGESLYSVFSPDGFNGKLSNITCLKTNWSLPAGKSNDGWPRSKREICETAFRSGPCSLAVDANGTPLLLYIRSPVTAHPDLVLARRTDAGWQKSTVFEFAPPVVSNLMMDAGGLLTFAYLAPDEKTVNLASGQADDWTMEVIAELPDAASDSEPAAKLVERMLLRDGGGRPLIIGIYRGPQFGAIRSFGPVD